MDLMRNLDQNRDKKLSLIELHGMIDDANEAKDEEALREIAGKQKVLEQSFLEADANTDAFVDQRELDAFFDRVDVGALLEKLNGDEHEQEEEDEEEEEEEDERNIGPLVVIMKKL